jgi:hypothetical protein
VRLSERLQVGLVSLAAAAAVGVAYWRLYYGVDFTDESFYVVVPYRLVLGARPFVDEVSVTQQTAAILLYPFVRAYYAVRGLTGIVLFVRQLYFVFSLGVAAAAWAAVRPLVGSRRAPLVAVAVLLFVPFDIHSLSYDTLGGGFFTAGTLLVFLGVAEPDRRLTPALAAASHALAAFAYPPLLIAIAVVHAVAIGAASGPSRRRGAVFGIAAILVPVAALGALVTSAGIDTVSADYRHSATYLGQAGGPGKLVSIAAHEWHRVWLPAPLVVTVLMLVVVCGLAQAGRALAVVLGLAPLLVLPPRPGFYAASLEFAAHLGWLAPPLLLLVRRRPRARPLFVIVWIPSLVAGLTTAYSSANGATNLGVGFFPAAVVALVYLVWAVELLARPLAWLPLATAAAMLAAFGLPVYRDGAIGTLVARVANGPYAGLLTTPRKRAFLQRLTNDLARVPASCGILFLDDFPAGYLLTRARPDTNSGWVASVARSRVVPYEVELLAYLRRTGLPNVIVLMRRIPYALPGSARRERYGRRDPIEQALRAYVIGVSRLDYSIYERSSSTCRLLPELGRRALTGASSV